MNVDFYINGSSKLIETCDQVAIPRAGDTIIVDAKFYIVAKVAWDYDIRRIYIYVDPIGDLAEYMKEED